LTLPTTTIEGMGRPFLLGIRRGAGATVQE